MNHNQPSVNIAGLRVFSTAAKVCCRFSLFIVSYLRRVGGGSSGFGAFKKKGAFGRGNVRKRMSQHEEEDDDMPASTTVVPAEKKKKTLALGGSTARDDKVI